MNQLVKNFAMLLAVFAPIQSLGVSENNYNSTMVNIIMPFIERQGHYESIPATKGFVLSTFSVFGSGTKGDIVIVPGQGEFIPKYYETAYDFIQMGYSAVHVIDHRGQGTSPRLLPAEPRKGSVEDFDDFVNDLEIYVRSLRASRPGQKFFLVSHSMGGAITALLLNKTRHEKLFESAVLSAPMFGIRTPFVGDSRVLMPLMRALCATQNACDNYAPGQAKFNNYSSFEKNHFTWGKARWEMTQKMLQAEPSHGLNGPTTRWALQSTIAIERIAKIAPPENTPILLFQAKEDRVVLPKPQMQYCAKSQSCKLVMFKGSQHEVFQEQDFVREPAMKMIDDFFNN